MTELGRNATDEKQAASWYRKAAEAGDPNGMERYAYFVEHGRGGLEHEFRGSDSSGIRRRRRRGSTGSHDADRRAAWR